MRKKEIETLDKINEEKKLSKEMKGKIIKKVFKNFLLAVGILLFFIILMLIERNINKKMAILIYRILSFLLISITIVLFETAYKKDSGAIAATSMEIFFLAIITLLTPYTLISKPNVYTSSVGVLFVIYYIIKNFITYKHERKEYLKEKNDINEIVKKESQDKFAQEELDKKDQKQEKPKRKRGRPRKVKSE